jgi:hypothetical protein
MATWRHEVIWTSSVRRNRRRGRPCDRHGGPIGLGEQYLAARAELLWDGDLRPGLHDGWWYLCLACARAEGLVAPGGPVRERARAG